MPKQILTFLLLLTCIVYSQSHPDQVMSIRSAPCVAGELLVGFQPGLSDTNPQNRFQHRMRSQYHGLMLHRFRSGAEHWRIDSANLEMLIDSLSASPNIKYAEPNYILYADIIPSDTDFALQWGLSNTGQTGGLQDADIDATEAWDISTGNREILVGIVDSGIDYFHPDLASNIWSNTAEIANNGVDDDDNGYIDDYNGYDFLNDLGDPIDEHGHGTHVSGIIGAVGNNDIGVAGVSWDVQLLPLKFLSTDNSGPTSAAISAIEYAIAAGVDFINASWGNTAYSQALADAVQLASDSGILFVTSAGNTATNNELYPHYPSDLELDNIISVASTDQVDQISVFSNWGLNSVDLAAPGTEIYSTLPDSLYGTRNGTSMATPYVTGALVLARSVFPEMTYLQLKEQILNSVDIKQELIGFVASAGRLNAASAIESDCLHDLSVEPAFLDFGIELINQSNEIQTFHIQNLSQQTVDIDSVIVDNAYQIARDSVFEQKLGPFQIETGQQDSLHVKFSPALIQNYNRLLTIYYLTSDNIPKCIVLQLLGRGVTGSIIQGGPVSGTWVKDNGPFYIEGDIFIPGGSSLTIGPGTRVQFEGHHSFTVGESALLDARGTSADSIIFTAGETLTGWHGLRLINSGNDDIFSYCRMEYGVKSSSAVNSEDQRGGALYCLNSSPRIEHSLIQYNQAKGGGGVCLEGSDAIIEQVKITHNNAGLDGGGGISCYGSNPQLFRVIISHNRSLNFFLSGDNGGGLYCRASSPRLLNVTISQNWGGKGGGIYVTQSSEHLTLVNSISWGNLPNQIEFSYDSKEKSVVIAHSNIEDGLSGIVTGTSSSVYYIEGNLSVNPLFLNEQEADFRLSADSPCIDAGVQNTMLVYDDGQDTIFVPELSYAGAMPDMGAHEYVLTGISSDQNYPSDFSLSQNYPNPFNSSTTIEYQLPEQCRVELSIYNILGEKTANLVSEKQPPGSYKVDWDASGFASGLYFYRFKTDGKFVRSKKLILLR